MYQHVMAFLYMFHHFSLCLMQFTSIYINLNQFTSIYYFVNFCGSNLSSGSELCPEQALEKGKPDGSKPSKGKESAKVGGPNLSISIHFLVNFLILMMLPYVSALVSKHIVFNRIYMYLSLFHIISPYNHILHYITLYYYVFIYVKLCKYD